MTDADGHWQPPARPEWVTRLLAHGDAAGGAHHLVGLDPDELVATAVASAGHDDFGPPTWRPHYDVLLDAIARESEMHLAGRILTRAEVLRSLRTRLDLAAQWSRRPDVLERPVPRPVFVVGFARSGTSILHELLALEPSVRAPRTWELLQPADAAAGGEHARRAARTGDHVHSFWADLQPEYETMHHNAGDLPNECIFATAHEFLSDHWSGVHVAPTYTMHLATADHTDAYRYHRRVLQTLQGEATPQWLCKAPSHLATLATLFAVYPDARVVHIHRDPLRAVPSTLSLMGTLKWMRCDNVDMVPLARPTAKGFARMLDGIIAARAAGTLPDDQFVDVRYADLVADPGATVQRVHAALGWPAGPEVATRARDHIAASPRGPTSAHRYSLAAFGLDRDDLETRFAAYRERFDVAAEPDPS
jgi:hypothetical protein